MGAQKFESDLEEICNNEPQAIDEELKALRRPDVLKLEPKFRLRWFYLVQVKHVELNRVVSELSELLEPFNEVSLISIIGMTSIGKTTLANNLMHKVLERYSDEILQHEVPVIYVKAPANGDRSISWTVLYRSILYGGGEVLINKKRMVEKGLEGELRYVNTGRPTLGDLREAIDQMLKNRNVRVLIIDEAFHLLRFENYSATMDTLKSLADSYSTKILLLGNYDLVDLVSDYAQTTRRGEIIHYKRYAYKHAEEKEEKLTVDQKEFKHVLKKFQDLWPSEPRPNLGVIWNHLMRSSLGSVGLLKITLLRLAALQMRSPNGEITAEMLMKAGKSPMALQKIDAETVEGEKKIDGFCYGDSIFSKDELDSLLAGIMARPEEL